MVSKILNPTVKRIEELCLTQLLTLNTDHYLLNGQLLSVSKAKNGFTAHIEYIPKGGFNSSQLHSIDLPHPTSLSNEDVCYYLPEHSILLNKQYFDFNGDSPVIDIDGSISQLTTSIDTQDWDGKFLRLVLPIAKGTPKMREIRGWDFKIDIATKGKQLVKTTINGTELHFLSVKTASDQYLIVDSTTVFSLEAFKRVSHSILLGLGFLYGDLFMDEGFILSSSEPDFSIIQHIQFSAYRESLLTGYRIHTTNAYSVLNMTGRTKDEIEAREKVAHSWINDIIEIEPEVFSRLCELFYNSEPISRAAIVILQGNTLALELKGSAYSIALEAITGIVMKERNEKSPKPASKEDFEKLKAGFLEKLDDVFPSSPENKTPREIFTTRLLNLNSPTNTSKLQKAFTLVGYNINEYELAALNARNKFQHGDLPTTDSTDDVVFKEVYFVCIVMHRLLYTLVLRMVGYTGYIINYPQVHSNITKRDMGEEVFFKV